MHAKQLVLSGLEQVEQVGAQGLHIFCVVSTKKACGQACTQEVVAFTNNKGALQERQLVAVEPKQVAQGAVQDMQAFLTVS